MSKPRTVAIVGFAPSWQQAPWTDKSIERWSLNEGHLMMPAVDRWFQMHPRWCWEKNMRDGQYMEWARGKTEGITNPLNDKPIYMLEAYADIPTAVKYPLTHICERFWPDDPPYLTSTFAYMLALAIDEGFEAIQVWGVDLSTDEEYGYQRAGAEYLIGLARGMGIKVTVPVNCPMLKSPLYGFYEPDDAQLVFTAEMLEHRLGELNKARVEHLAHLNATEGSIQEITQWRGKVMFDTRDRWTRAGGPPIGHSMPTDAEVANLPLRVNATAPSDGTGPHSNILKEMGIH